MIRNLTPNPVTILDADGMAVLTLEPEGIIARVRENHVAEGEVTYRGVAIPLVRVKYEEVENLPAPEEGVYLVVSMLTAQAAPERYDLLVPIGQVRDDQGRIIGCRGLGRLSSAPQTTRYVLVSTRINNDPATLDNGVFLIGSDGSKRHLSPTPDRWSDREINSYGFRRVGEWESNPPHTELVEVVPL